jgi:hypothetical protein
VNGNESTDIIDFSVLLEIVRCTQIAAINLRRKTLCTNLCHLMLHEKINSICDRYMSKKS